MASLAGIPGALRKYGLRVQEAAGWRGHNHGGMGTIETIAWHHTAGARTGNYPSYGVVRNGRAGLPGPLAQLGLARDGSVIVFSDGLAYHAGVVRNGSQDNYNAIGIEAESTGYGDWTQEQIIAYPRIGAALCDHYNLPAARNLAHFEICSPPGRKIDAAQLPGGMPEQRRRVAALLQNGGTDMPITNADAHKIAQAVANVRVRLPMLPKNKDGSWKTEPWWVNSSYIEPRMRHWMDVDRKVLYTAITNGVTQVLKAVNASASEQDVQRAVDSATDRLMAELEQHRDAVEQEAAQAADSGSAA